MDLFKRLNIGRNPKADVVKKETEFVADGISKADVENSVRGLYEKFRQGWFASEDEFTGLDGAVFQFLKKNGSFLQQRLRDEGDKVLFVWDVDRAKPLDFLVEKFRQEYNIPEVATVEEEEEEVEDAAPETEQAPVSEEAEMVLEEEEALEAEESPVSDDEDGGEGDVTGKVLLKGVPYGDGWKKDERFISMVSSIINDIYEKVNTPEGGDVRGKTHLYKRVKSILIRRGVLDVTCGGRNPARYRWREGLMAPTSYFCNRICKDIMDSVYGDVYVSKENLAKIKDSLSKIYSLTARGCDSSKFGSAYGVIMGMVRILIRHGLIKRIYIFGGTTYQWSDLSLDEFTDELITVLYREKFVSFFDVVPIVGGTDDWSCYCRSSKSAVDALEEPFEEPIEERMEREPEVSEEVMEEDDIQEDFVDSGDGYDPFWNGEATEELPKMKAAPDSPLADVEPARREPEERVFFAAPKANVKEEKREVSDRTEHPFNGHRFIVDIASDFWCRVHGVSREELTETALEYFLFCSSAGLTEDQRVLIESLQSLVSKHIV